MNIRNCPYDDTNTDKVITVASIGGAVDMFYAVIFRSGPDMTDILIVEHVDKLTPCQHYRSHVVRWDV